jgi:uncharacterized repeat protein (TIGR03837 family)
MKKMTAPLSWDIFCRVVDNFGDIGVCWRLARQLAVSRGNPVRLWVDELESLQTLCPEVDAAAPVQHIEDIEVRRWGAVFPAVAPAQVVIEGFGCGLPDDYIEVMVSRNPRTLWITLEYLSAERWVSGHHGLPSPHPRWPLERYFFFPGFIAGTGGVLREADLFARRAAFGNDARRQLWAELGFEPPVAEATVVSLFAYEHAPVTDLLAAWEHGQALTVVAIPEGRIVKPVLDWLGVAAAGIGRSFQRGALEVRLVPFVPQPIYDQLLWACDCNLVRGEDSFVRAQWASKPMIWQAYPQQERAHWPKVEAFLDLYCEGLPQDAASAVRGMWRAWNGVGNEATCPVAETWRDFHAQRIVLKQYAPIWSDKLAEAGELSEKLAQFCQDKLKYRF